MADKFFHIEEIHPPLGSSHALYMLEPCNVMVRLSTNYPPQNLVAEIWTNTIDKISPDGEWHSVPMHFNSHAQTSSLEFLGAFLPPDQGVFAYTLRIGIKENQNKSPLEWQWGGAYGQNGSLTVLPPSPEMQWTQGPQYSKIAPGVFVGNFIAASKAHELGFQSVLNMAKELNITFPKNIVIEYKKIGVDDGAHHPISRKKILEAVSWIQQQVEKGHKVCINCRAGIGRSGSIGIAYLYASHPEWSYSDALEAAWAEKPDIYPHKNLEQILGSLFTRNYESRHKLKQMAQIKRVKFMDYQPGYVMTVDRDQKITIRINVESAGKPIINLRTNINVDPYEDIELFAENSNGLYQWQIHPKRIGEYWLTASASPFKKLPDEERFWVGDNLIIKVK